MVTDGTGKPPAADAALPLPDAAVQAGLSATYEHIGLLRRKQETFRASQVAAEEQFLHRVGALYAAGALDAAGLRLVYEAYARLALPGLTRRWDTAVPVTVKQVRDLRQHLRHAERNAPNVPGGTWRGTWPLDAGPVPRDGTPAVYVLYDEASQPCYVGSTLRLRARLQQHRRDLKPFTSWTASRCADREAAYRLEERLLAEHQPYLNKRRTR